MTRSILLLLVMLPITVLGEPFQWTTFTSTSNTVDIISYDGIIWTATSGGLAAYDPVLEQFEVYNNTRGLGMNQCTAVGHDSRGWIWAALADGRITRLNPETGSVRQIVALQGEIFNVNRILTVGEHVFVAANNGIYRFEYSSIPDNYVVIESIKVLGSFPSDAEVYDIAVYNGHLYAATANGLAYADANNDLLSAPASWLNLTTSNSDLPDNNIRALYSADSLPLYLATPTYVCWYDGAAFQDVSEFSNPAIGFIHTDEGMHALNSSRFFNWNGQYWQNYGENIGSIVGATSIRIGATEYIVVGVEDSNSRPGGIVFFNPAETQIPFSAPGIGGNIISCVELDPSGRLWATTNTDRRGVSIYNGSEWSSITRTAEYNHEYLMDNPKDIVFDNDGSAWISSDGGGVMWTDGEFIQVFDHADTTGFDINGQRLLGISSESFVVTRVARNERGDIFIGNRIGGVAGGPALARVTAEWIAQGNHREPWEYFYPPPAIGMSTSEVAEVMVDPFDRVWLGAIGSANDKSHVLIDRGQYADSTDDQWLSFNPADFQDATTCFPDIQPDILCWVVDQQNYLWIGTESGAFYLQGGIGPSLGGGMNFICLYDMPVGRRVNDIYVDSQDNKWFATDEGIAVLDNNFSWIHVFQTASSIDHPSMLTSNDVSSITSNPATGEFWIGTQDGLSFLKTPYLSKGADLDEVWPYPNPFRADGEQRLFLDPQKLGGQFEEARIFTITGRLVRELSWTEMITVGWDGRNDEGTLVAGGVYLIVTTSNDGNSATGKVAVLGR